MELRQGYSAKFKCVAIHDTFSGPSPVVVMDLRLKSPKCDAKYVFLSFEERSGLGRWESELGRDARKTGVVETIVSVHRDNSLPATIHAGLVSVERGGLSTEGLTSRSWFNGEGQWARVTDFDATYSGQCPASYFLELYDKGVHSGLSHVGFWAIRKFQAACGKPVAPYEVR